MTTLKSLLMVAAHKYQYTTRQYTTYRYLRVIKKVCHVSCTPVAQWQNTQLIKQDRGVESCHCHQEWVVKKAFNFLFRYVDL